MLGAQLPFAVFDLVERGFWPEDLRRFFKRWEGRSRRGLRKELDAFWSEEASWKQTLTQSCIDFELDPPVAGPTLLALQKLHREDTS